MAETNDKIVLFTEADAAEFRRLRRWVQNFRGYGVTNTPYGASIAPPPQHHRPSASGHGPIRMRIKSIANDYLTCRLWNGTSEGTADVLVAKAKDLRHDVEFYPQLSTLTTVDAQTVTASDGSDTETWVVTPSYFVDQEIVVEIPTGGTGVTVDGTPLVFQDTTTRAWAVEP